MTVVQDRQLSGSEFVIEEMWTGVIGGGFGRAGDGRSFSFRIEHQLLLVELYRPWSHGLVPQAEDVVAATTRNLIGIDVTDERSLTAAVRDLVAALAR